MFKNPLPFFFLLRIALKDTPPPREHQLPAANRRPPSTADRYQPPPTANRHQPPTILQHRFCGPVSCPCLGHEAQHVPVDIRFCWRYEPFFVPSRTGPRRAVLKERLLARGVTVAPPPPPVCTLYAARGALSEGPGRSCEKEGPGGVGQGWPPRPTRCFAARQKDWGHGGLSLSSGGEGR